jgi:hypothetical protein
MLYCHSIKTWDCIFKRCGRRQQYSVVNIILLLWKLAERVRCRWGCSNGYAPSLRRATRSRFQRHAPRAHQHNKPLLFMPLASISFLMLPRSGLLLTSRSFKEILSFITNLKKETELSMGTWINCITGYDELSAYVWAFAVVGKDKQEIFCKTLASWRRK